MRKRVIEDVIITSVVAHGKGLGRVDGKVVFVENAIPGDVVDVRIQKKKNDYIEGRVLSFKEKSERRQDAFCSHFKNCGGCKSQDLSYDYQLELKQSIISDSFRRIGKMEDVAFLDILGCEKTTHYRNKMDFSFSDSKWIDDLEVLTDETIDRRALGLHVPKYYNRIVDVTTCYLQDSYADDIRNFIRARALAKNHSFYNHDKHEGFLRNLILRNTTIGQWMLILVFGNENQVEINEWMNVIQEKFTAVTSLYYVINTKKNDSILDLEMNLFSGCPTITEELGTIAYDISPKSFFQTNSYQAKVLYDRIVSLAALNKSDVVYDLYCGTGSIALYIANQVKKVVGIEVIDDAIKDAKKNQEKNGISNATFLTGDVKDVLDPAFCDTYGSPNVIIVDPPRAGLHKNVVAQISSIAANKIVYVSCNPVTQARDIQLLSPQYNVTVSQGIDMFPHTWHVENIVVLEKNNI